MFGIQDWGGERRLGIDMPKVSEGMPQTEVCFRKCHLVHSALSYRLPGSTYWISSCYLCIHASLGSAQSS